VKHFSWLVTLPITLAVVVFAVSNRTPVEIDLFPLPWQPVLPAYLLVLASLFVGFLIGGAIAWLAGAPQRRRARRLTIEADVLSRELAEARRRAAAGAPAEAAGLPATTPTATALAAAPRA
jgi:putative membrane protein